MTTDKTGAEATVTLEDGKYTIAVEGKTVGLADFADRGEQRVFYHTEIDPPTADVAWRRSSSRRRSTRRAMRASGLFRCAR